MSTQAFKLAKGGRDVPMPALDLVRLSAVGTNGKESEIHPLDPAHLEQVRSASAAGADGHPKMGTPLYFAPKGRGMLALWPDADAPYTIKALYRAPGRRGRPPGPGEAYDPETGELVKVQ